MLEWSDLFMILFYIVSHMFVRRNPVAFRIGASSTQGCAATGPTFRATGRAIRIKDKSVDNNA